VDTQQAITVAIKPCRSCGGGVPETDRFCRLCGESQSAGQTIAVQVPDVIQARISNHLVSGPVVWALSMTGGGLAKAYAPRMKRIVSLLVAVPVWLIILLLSPFDAYATARLITEARWQQERI
jgi:hypothetical protein